LAFAIGSRMSLQLIVDRSFECWSGPIWLLPIRDLLSGAVFILSFLSRKVRWNDRVFDASAPRRSTPLEATGAGVPQPNLKEPVPLSTGSTPTP
jgi:hypothetical protein